MPVIPSSPVANKKAQTRRSLRKATKMQTPNLTNGPFSWTQPTWDSLQFQSRGNKVFERVKKLTKSVVEKFACFGFRTGPFLQPFQTQWNIRRRLGDVVSEEHSEHTQRLPLRGIVAKRRNFVAATAFHIKMGNGRVAAFSNHSGRHLSNGEEVLTGTDGDPSHEMVLMQSAYHQLERLKAQSVTALQNSGLVGTDASGKTNREVIQEVRTLINNLVGTVEALLIQLSNEIVSAKPIVVRERNANRAEEEKNRNTVIECLRHSLNDLRRTVSEHFFLAVTLSEGSLRESTQSADHCPATLHSLAFDYIHLQDKLINAEQAMVNRIHGRTLTNKTTDQEERRKDKALNLMEAATSNVVELQRKVLHACFEDQNENEASVKESADLDLRLHLSWTWLKALHESVGIQYPEEEARACEICMGTLLTALEGIIDHLNEPHENNRGSIHEVLCGIDVACAKRTIASLTYLYNVFDQAVIQIQQNPALELTDSPRTKKVCDHLVSLLNLLCAQLTSNSTEVQHHTLTKCIQDCKSKVLGLAEHYLQSNLCNIHKDKKATDTVTTIVAKLTRNATNAEMKFLSREDALVQNVPPPSSSQTTSDEQTYTQRESPVSSNASTPGQGSPDHTVTLARNASYKSPFANPENHPRVLESIDDNLISGSTDQEKATDGSCGALIRVEDIVLLNDASLDLSLGSLPSSGFFTRVKIDEVAEARYLDEGSSGLVTRRKLGNRQVAVKESKCPDPSKRLKRLNREAKLHKNLNSCMNIVRFVGRLVKPDEHGEDQIVGIVTEWCDSGDLFTAIDQAAWLQGLERDGVDISEMKDVIGYRLYKDWNKRLGIVADIATAMIYMHNCHTVHRDLTSRNVVLNTVDKSGEFGAKVCDFERARYLPGGQDVPRTKSCANSAPWMGPEVLKNEFYGLKSDVYSIGTILWEVMFLENPWTHLKKRVVGAHASVIQHLLTTGKISLSISESDAPDIPVFPQLISLVKSAWQDDPSDRPTMKEFLCTLNQIIHCMNTI